jgi:membrane-associated phospholipid phosphatase
MSHGLYFIGVVLLVLSCLQAIVEEQLGAETYRGALDLQSAREHPLFALWELLSVLGGAGIGPLTALALLVACTGLERQRILLAPMLAGFGVAILKLLVHRTRPDGTDYSWPSGHTAGVFSLVLVLCFSQRRWRWPLLLFAALVGVSRVAKGRHWPADVLAGAAIACFAVALASQLRSLRTLQWFLMPRRLSWLVAIWALVWMAGVAWSGTPLRLREIAELCTILLPLSVALGVLLESYVSPGPQGLSLGGRNAERG